MAYKFSVILVGIVSFFSLVMLLLIFYPTKVIVPKMQPYPVLTRNVVVGNQLQYVVDACKYQDITSTVLRSFVNTKSDVIYPALQSQGSVSVGCNKTTVATTVPLFLPEGDYYLALDVIYHVNRLQDRTYHFTTAPFHVATQSAPLQ